jgi:hypothetical protein
MDGSRSDMLSTEYIDEVLAQNDALQAQARKLVPPETLRAVEAEQAEEARARRERKLAQRAGQES